MIRAGVQWWVERSLFFCACNILNDNENHSHLGAPILQQEQPLVKNYFFWKSILSPIIGGVQCIHWALPPPALKTRLWRSVRIILIWHLRLILMYNCLMKNRILLKNTRHQIEEVEYELLEHRQRIEELELQKLLLNQRIKTRC